MSDLTERIVHADNLTPRGRVREPKRRSLMIIVDTATKFGDEVVNRNITLAGSNAEVIGATVVTYVEARRGITRVTTDLASYPVNRAREINPNNILPDNYGFQSALASFGLVRDFALRVGLISPLVHRLAELGVRIDFNPRVNPATLTVRRGQQVIAHS